MSTNSVDQNALDTIKLVGPIYEHGAVAGIWVRLSGSIGREKALPTLAGLLLEFSQRLFLCDIYH